MGKEQREKSNEEKLLPVDKILPLIITSLIILFFLAISYPIIHCIFPLADDKGALEGAFAPINALFSGLALAAIIYTILLQRKELALQRKEIADNRKELKRTADAQEKSEKAFYEQLEAMLITAKLNTYNSLLEHYEKVVKAHGLNDETGRKAAKRKQFCIMQIEIQEKVIDNMFVKLAEAKNKE